MKHGEVWQIDLNPTVGAEIKKTRPAVIVNVDSLGRLPLKVIVPLTDWKDRYSIADWMIKIAPNETNNLSKPSAADCFQVRSVSVKRFVRRLGKLSFEELEKVKIGLANVFDIK